jgi:cell division protein FtsW
VQDFIYAKDDEIPYQVQQQILLLPMAEFYLAVVPAIACNVIICHRLITIQYTRSSLKSTVVWRRGDYFFISHFPVSLYQDIQRCPYAFGAFLALALSFTLVIQAVANMAVGVNLIPVTGVTLPLVSMGGSSFLFTCASIGII